ncbi:MAG: tRNA pseudouridine(38-40) synthase TruA [Erysipelotrichales bacterium]
MLFNYKLTIAYDGSSFYGYQYQENQRNIQGIINEVVSQLNNNTQTSVHASGRTDRGVHACGQVCHFESDFDLNLNYFEHAANRTLPDDIRVLEIIKVDNEFHSRFKAKGKHYQYIINTGEYDVFKVKYHWQLNRSLDLIAMKEVVQCFKGKRDYKTFSSANKDQTTIKDIKELTIKQENDLIIIDIYGSGFLRYMVRKIVMALVDAGIHKKDVASIEELLAKKSTAAYSRVAPPEGLYLMEVFYE